jgi:subtilase family serine protease
VPPWAKAANFKAVAPNSTYVNFRVYLGWQNEGKAEALAQAVSDPASASYGRYLTPAQFREQFAPSQAAASAVKSWLSGQGFSIVYVPANRHYIAAEGTVAQAEAAFKVQLNLYKVDGKTVRAPAASLTIPSSLAGFVESVVGLDQSAALIHPDIVGSDAPPSPGFRNAEPWSLWWGQQTTANYPQLAIPAYNGGAVPFAPKGYTPAQLQGAYGVAGAIKDGIDGRGVTVAIIDAFASPTIVQDVNHYSSDFGLPALTASNFTQVVAPGTYRHPESLAQDPQGWYGEETLDVEAVHSMAPGADIIYVGAPNSYQDLDAALNHVVDRRLAQIVTNSYGFSTEFLPRGYIKPYNDIFIQAAIEGIGVYFSSGDDGDEILNAGYRTVDWPASSPWVTSVGGTSLAVGESNNYLWETGWGTERSLIQGSSWGPPVYLYGSGGGTSQLFAQPSYQAGVVPVAIADYFKTGKRWRAVPDVAMDGDPTTGMLVGQTQTFSDGTYYDTYRIGGTSLSSPLFAGMMALADDRAGFAHGFANPVLYAADGTAAFRDVPNAVGLAAVRADFINGENASDGIRYSLRTMCNLGTLLGQVPGFHYSDVTGVGTPNGEAFLDALK